MACSGAGWIRCAEGAARLGIALLALAPLAGTAQTLPRLHITALGLHADARVVRPGESFHVTVHVHVKEKPARLDELVLPALTNVVDLGDERKRVPAADGTDFYETLTVAASAVGTASFTPAYIGAIDPATGRGMRYSSQPLTVRVTAGSTSAPPVDPVAEFFRNSMLTLLRGVAWLVAAAVIVVGAGIVLLVRSRRPRVVSAAPREAPVPPRRAVPAADRLREASAVYRARGDDASLDELRNVLFTRAGAAPGATFSDALRALGSRDPHLARLMAIAERARFGPVHERAPAARDLLALLDAYVTDREPVA